MDATGKHPLRQVFDGVRCLVLRSTTLGNLQLRAAAILRLHQPGGNRDDPITSAAAMSGGLSIKDLCIHGRVLARGAEQKTEFF